MKATTTKKLTREFEDDFRLDPSKPKPESFKLVVHEGNEPVSFPIEFHGYSKTPKVGKFIQEARKFLDKVEAELQKDVNGT